MRNKRMLILGAGSSIAIACARRYASEGYDLILTGRNTELLDAIAVDIKIKNDIEATSAYFDLLDFASHEAFVKKLQPCPDAVILAAGVLGEQQKAMTDFDVAQKIMLSNYNGAVSVLNHLAVAFKLQGVGTIIAISSVAGERGRGSNFIYGSSKAALTAYLSGLRNYLFPFGIHVMTVIPGFVATKMTENMDLPPPVTASPDQVAADIFRGHQRKSDVIYSMKRWRFIMFIVRSIPEFVFKRLKL